jgi:hypothetical protein
MEQKKARPWDVFNKNIEKINTEEQKKRLDICFSCDRLIKLTTQCKECGCLMNLKTSLPHAFCPLGKWTEMKVNIKEVEE